MNRLLKNREILLVIIIAIMIAGFSTRAQGFAAPATSPTSSTIPRS